MTDFCRSVPDSIFLHSNETRDTLFYIAMQKWSHVAALQLSPKSASFTEYDQVRPVCARAKPHFVI